MARNNQRGAKNNNPEGRNQFTNNWRDTARDRPVATAAAAAAAVGAGVFLWSRRNQISDQISILSDQFSDWAGGQQFDNSQSGSSDEFEFADAGPTSASTGSGRNLGKRGKSGETAFDGTTGGASGTTTGTAI